MINSFANRFWKQQNDVETCFKSYERHIISFHQLYNMLKTLFIFTLLAVTMQASPVVEVTVNWFIS